MYIYIYYVYYVISAFRAREDLNIFLWAENWLNKCEKHGCPQSAKKQFHIGTPKDPSSPSLARNLSPNSACDSIPFLSHRSQAVCCWWWTFLGCVICELRAVQHWAASFLGCYEGSPTFWHNKTTNDDFCVTNSPAVSSRSTITSTWACIQENGKALETEIWLPGLNDLSRQPTAGKHSEHLKSRCALCQGTWCKSLQKALGQNTKPRRNIGIKHSGIVGSPKHQGTPWVSSVSLPGSSHLRPPKCSRHEAQAHPFRYPTSQCQRLSVSLANTSQLLNKQRLCYCYC